MNAGRYILFRGLVMKRLLLLKRYPFNTLSQFVTVYLMFLAVFFAGSAFSGFAFAEHLEGIVVGYFFWTMAIGAYQSHTGSLMQEVQWGTLEQLFMSKFSFGAVNVGIIGVVLLETFLWGAGILVLMILTTGASLHLDLVTIAPIVLLSLSGPVAISMFLGGLALLYKRVENAFTLLQFGFLGLIAAPVETYPVLKLLPLSLGSSLLRRAMGNGDRLWELPTFDVVLLVVQSVTFLAVGYVSFMLLAKRARRKGVMGHY